MPTKTYHSSFDHPNIHEVPIVGDKVECWLFSIPDGRFYGEKWIGEVLKVDHNQKRPYLVTRPGYGNIEVNIKEIWKIVR